MFVGRDVQSSTKDHVAQGLAQPHFECLHGCRHSTVPKEPLSVIENARCKTVPLYQIGISCVPVLSLASCSFTVQL